MKIRMILLFFIYLLLTTHYSLFAYSPGKNSFSFLKIPVSARISASNGGSVLAEGRDAWYKNPAALAFKIESNFEFSRNAWFLHTYMNTVSFNRWHFGLRLSQYSISDKERDLSGFPVSEFENRYSVLNFSYGFKLKRYTGFGITYKKISQKIYHENYNHSAFDFGLLLLPNIRTSIGIVLCNFGSKKKFLEVKEALPTEFLFGVRYKMGRFFISSEAKYNPDEKMLYLLGLEFKKTKNFTLRIGSSYQDDLNISFGIGLEEENYFLDIAFLPNGTFDYSLITSAGLRF